MFPMTVSLTLTNAAQLQALAAIISGDTAKLPAKYEPAKAEPEKKAPTPPPAVGGTGGEKTATEKNEELGTTDESAGASGKTLDDAKALTMKVVAAKGRDSAVELLAKFGVKVAAKLEAGQVDAFCAGAEAVLNG